MEETYTDDFDAFCIKLMKKRERTDIPTSTKVIELQNLLEKIALNAKGNGQVEWGIVGWIIGWLLF